MTNATKDAASMRREQIAEASTLVINREAFFAGAQWADANPTSEVTELREKLLLAKEYIEQGCFCFDGNCICDACETLEKIKGGVG